MSLSSGKRPAPPSASLPSAKAPKLALSTVDSIKSRVQALEGTLLDTDDDWVGNYVCDMDWFAEDMDMNVEGREEEASAHMANELGGGIEANKIPLGLVMWALGQGLTLAAAVLEEFQRLLDVELVELEKEDYGETGTLGPPLSLVGLYMPWSSGERQARIEGNRAEWGLAAELLGAAAGELLGAAAGEVEVIDLTGDDSD
jgi:hypothetical protein